MKMILAIINEENRHAVSQALISADFRVTQLATTSGFLRGGETSLMVGVEDDLVDSALQIFRDQISQSPEPGRKQATIYVLSVKNFNSL